MQGMNHTKYLYAAKFLAERNSVAGTLHFFTTGKQTLTKHMLNTECSHCSTSLACGALEDVKRCLFLERFAILDTLRLQSLHWCVEIKSRINYLFAIRTIIQSTEAATASSSSSPTCLDVARDVASPGPQIYSISFGQLLYAHYECDALSVSAHYVLGGCAMRCIALYSFDCITLVDFKFIILTFWLFFIQIVE